MQELNKNYRGKIILQMFFLSLFWWFSQVSNTDIVGECIFSESKILSQAIEYKHAPKEEFEILLIHSILHILGFDHEENVDFEDMWKYEERIRINFLLNLNR